MRTAKRDLAVATTLSDQAETFHQEEIDIPP
jgi:hypothetical protein